MARETSRWSVRSNGRQTRGHGDVSAEVAGLLLAWAGGHVEAIAELERLDPRVEGLEAEDYIGACRLLLGAREK